MQSPFDRHEPFKFENVDIADRYIANLGPRSILEGVVV